MLKSVPGIFKDGQVHLLAPPPEGAQSNVVVTFEVEENDGLFLEEHWKAWDDFIKSCKELSQKDWETYDEAAKRRPLFGGREIKRMKRGILS